MIAPPLTAERLLEGLSAKTDFSNGILGDLAEEFAERAESEGATAARRWYYREAVGAAPHLLYDWARTLRFREARRLVNVVVASQFLFTVLSGLLTMAVLEATGFLASVPRAATATLGVASSAAFALLAGYFAASLDKRTPVVSAILLGALWATPDAVLSISVDSGALVTIAIRWIIMICAATVGGILQVRSTRFTTREDDLDLFGKTVA